MIERKRLFMEVGLVGLWEICIFVKIFIYKNIL